MSNFAIVAIGYNRADSMRRLLDSLNNADYESEEVSLIISIDNSGDDAVENVAKDFEWSYGEKVVKTYTERLGLRNHILKCGELTQQFDAVAVFEDDTYVSPVFFKYMIKAVEFYKKDSNIAGISLYNHLWNPGMKRSFVPQSSQYDTYFIQFAQSWGQIWLAKPWSEFINWYKNNNEEIQQLPHIPDSVAGWPKSSWLKYHIKYCIEKNKYFVYPYEALSTNFGDRGEHVGLSSTHYQVPMQYNKFKEYKFAPLNEESIRYDAFFERQNIGANVSIAEEELCVDLYGQKRNRQNKKYWLTMVKADYKIVKSYALALRPQEMNILMNIEGQDIYLYDTHEHKINMGNEKSEEKQSEYDLRDFSSRRLLRITFKRYIKYAFIKLKKIVKH